MTTTRPEDLSEDQQLALRLLAVVRCQRHLPPAVLLAVGEPVSLLLDVDADLLVLTAESGSQLLASHGGVTVLTELGGVTGWTTYVDGAGSTVMMDSLPDV